MKMTNEGFFCRKIEDDYIRTLEVKTFPGTVSVIDSKEAFEKVVPLLQHIDIFGFDTETRPSFKKGRVNRVSLLQLATAERAFLFRVNRIGMPDAIVRLLSSDSVIKAGVAIRDDLRSLCKLRAFIPRGFVDLQEYVKQHGIEDSGLRKLTANILGFRISKRYQTSNWEQEILSPEQLAYAATDAWVCHQIYCRLSKLKTAG